MEAPGKPRSLMLRQDIEAVMEDGRDSDELFQGWSHWTNDSEVYKEDWLGASEVPLKSD